MTDDKNIAKTITIDQTPAEVFAAINNVRAWWPGEFDGPTEKLGDEFTYRYKEVHYSKQRITESIPGKKVTWLVVDSRLNFLADKGEWNGTTITFEIARKGGKTEMRFTHVGLVPARECYGVCSNAWGSIVEGLRKLIVTGRAQPNASLG